MKKQIYLREYRSGRQFILVLLRRTVQMGVEGFEGFRVMNNGKKEDDDWFISEKVLKESVKEGTAVRLA